MWFFKHRKDKKAEKQGDWHLVSKRRTIQDGKDIKFEGKTIKVHQVRHWKYNEKQDAPEFSDLNSARFAAFEVIRNAWQKLSDEEIADVLDNQFTYSSYWVAESLDKTGYLDYIKKKFATISTSKSGPKIEVALIRESIFLPDYVYALHLIQGNVETLLIFAFNKDKILSMTMTDPDLFTFDIVDDRACFLTSICTENHEPAIFVDDNHQKVDSQYMSQNDFLIFAVHVAERLLTQEGIHISATYPKDDEEYPNLVVCAQEKKIYCKVIPSTAFEPVHRYSNEILRFMKFCNEKSVIPRVLYLNFFCFDDFAARPIRGGSFAARILITRFTED